MVEKTDCGTYSTTLMLAANYSRLPNLLPIKS